MITHHKSPCSLGLDLALFISTMALAALLIKAATSSVNHTEVRFIIVLGIISAVAAALGALGACGNVFEKRSDSSSKSEQSNKVAALSNKVFALMMFCTATFTCISLSLLANHALKHGAWHLDKFSFDGSYGKLALAAGIIPILSIGLVILIGCIGCSAGWGAGLARDGEQKKAPTTDLSEAINILHRMAEYKSRSASLADAPPR